MVSKVFAGIFTAAISLTSPLVTAMLEALCSTFLLTSATFTAYNGRGICSRRRFEGGHSENGNKSMSGSGGVAASFSGAQNYLRFPHKLNVADM